MGGKKYFDSLGNELGGPDDSNPFPPDSVDYQQWDKGWNESFEKGIRHTARTSYEMGLARGFADGVAEADPSTWLGPDGPAKDKRRSHLYLVKR